MGNVNYGPVIDDMVWSYSRISLYDHCPYLWYLKYILKLPDEETFYASYGTLVHSILERYYLGLVDKKDMSKEFIERFGNEVKGTRPMKSTLEKIIRSIVQYFDNFEPLPYTLIGVEEKVEFMLDKYKFVGYIDYVGMDEDGNIVLVDNKSRELKQRSRRKKPTLKDVELDNMLRQLYLYSIPIYDKFGKFPKYLCFNCYRNGEFIMEPFREEGLAEAIKWAVSTIDKIKTSDFSPDQNLFKCMNICGQRENCDYRF